MNKGTLQLLGSHRGGRERRISTLQDWFSDAVLARLGSRYRSKREAGKELRSWLLSRVGGPLFRCTMLFSRAQLVCANEVFPEAALAEPIADLEVWDEWRSGLRRFPYPGIYTRLDIFHQERKVAATSSVGVLGEIFSGLFSQSFVAPFVVVRPVRRWPDFILLGNDQRYSFVESKASASLDGTTSAGIETVAEELLGEGLADAVQELNADPFLRVWLVFTDIVSVQPLSVRVCVLETETPAHRRTGRPTRLPNAVVDGLAERTLVESAADLEPQVKELFESVKGAHNKTASAELWRRLRSFATERVESMLPLGVPDDLGRPAVEAIRQRIQKQKTRRMSLELKEGKRLITAKRAAHEGTLTALRQAAGSDQWLVLADLPKAELESFREQWKPNWERANTPWGELDGLHLWRCSSAVLGWGPNDIQGRNVGEVERH